MGFEQFVNFTIVPAGSKSRCKHPRQPEACQAVLGSFMPTKSVGKKRPQLDQLGWFRKALAAALKSIYTEANPDLTVRTCWTAPVPRIELALAMSLQGHVVWVLFVVSRISFRTLQ
jgi:hypothetical protein